MKPLAYSGAFHSRDPAPSVRGAQQAPGSAPGADNSREGMAQRLFPLLKKLEAIDLQTDDLLMLLILYLMYRESGDKELLFMMGAMLLP